LACILAAAAAKIWQHFAVLSPGPRDYVNVAANRQRAASRQPLPVNSAKTLAVFSEMTADIGEGPSYDVLIVYLKREHCAEKYCVHQNLKTCRIFIS
jgi:hypothetical protein